MLVEWNRYCGRNPGTFGQCSVGVFLIAVLALVVSFCGYSGNANSEDSEAVVVRLRRSAEEASKINDWEKAATLWADVVRKLPNDADAHVAFGLALGQLGHYEEAIVHSKRGVELAPTNPMAWLGECWWQALVGKYIDARAACQHSLDLNPTNWATFAAMGHTWLLAGKADKAQPFYQQSLSFIPDQATLLVHC
jgi:tetratricopeptide (TPR) repeat protein